MTDPKRTVGSRAEAKALRAAEASRAKRATVKVRGDERAQDFADRGVAPQQWSVLHAVALVAAITAGLMCVSAFMHSEAVQAMPQEGRAVVRAVVLILLYGSLAGVVAFFVRRSGTTFTSAFALRGEHREPRTVLGDVAWVLLLLGVTRVASMLWAWVADALGWAAPEGGSLAELFGAGPLGTVLLLAVVVVVGPFVEELLFRGVILEAVGRRWGGRIAVLVSAGSFAVMHSSAWAFLPMLFLGVATGWLAWYRRSMWSAIALHVCYNGAVVAVALLFAAR